jgi:hypothetical protein
MPDESAFRGLMARRHAGDPRAVDRQGMMRGPRKTPGRGLEATARGKGEVGLKGRLGRRPGPARWRCCRAPY